jgi:pyruvate/2-oxoglutarate dehydrogenase complex dihydrolipoamide dehydrogenase (E3) component
VAGNDDVFDVVVVGAGPVGETAAQRAVRNGLTAAVVERRLAGGECQHYGCVPSKALLWPMELAAEVARMPGVELRGPIDPAPVLARRDSFVDHQDDAPQVRAIQDMPATFFRGQGRLAGERRVDVTGPQGSSTTLTARHAVVLATGSDPLIPDLPGLRAAHPWTNREATDVHQVPKRLVVIGGGPVGCEMSQALHALGAEETTILAGERLLPRLEPFAGELLAQSFRDSGIDVRLGRKATEVRRPIADGPVTVRVDDGSLIEADEILVATGRRPNVNDIGLEKAGLPAGDGPIPVDASMRATGVPAGWLYAVGDVNGRNLLTHMGKYQARICADVIAARVRGLPDDRLELRASADDHGAPQAIFTDPQICAVGRTEAKARADGFSIRTVEYDMAQVEGALLSADGYTGRVKAVVDEPTHSLLGFTLVGPAVVDHLHAATIAVTGQLPLERIWHAVPCFPTVSEFWLGLLEEFGI